MLAALLGASACAGSTQPAIEVNGEEISRSELNDRLLEAGAVPGADTPTLLTDRSTVDWAQAAPVIGAAIDQLRSESAEGEIARRGLPEPSLADFHALIGFEADFDPATLDATTRQQYDELFAQYTAEQPLNELRLDYVAAVEGALADSGLDSPPVDLATFHELNGVPVDFDPAQLDPATRQQYDQALADFATDGRALFLAQNGIDVPNPLDFDIDIDPRYGSWDPSSGYLPPLPPLVEQ